MQRFIISGIALLTVQTAWAQKGNRDSLSTEDVFILRDFQPRIRESYKLSRNPEAISARPAISPIFAPRELDKQAVTFFVPEQVKAAKLKGEPLSKLYRAYLMCAVGNRLSTRAEIVVNALRSKTWDYGIRVRHHGSSGEVKGKGYAGFSENHISLYANKFFYNSILKGSLDFDFNNLHRYGFEPSLYTPEAQNDTLRRSKLLQYYSHITPGVDYATYFKDSTALNYHAGLRFYNYSSRGGSVENNVLLKAGVNRYIKTFFTRAEFSYDYNKYTYDIWRITQRQQVASHLVKLSPSVQINKGFLSATLGVTGVLYSDSAANAFIYPDVRLKYDLVPTILIPYFHLTGGPERSNYRTLTRQNPFLSDALELRVQNTRLRMAGGVRGALSSKWAFHAGYNFEAIENQALFYNLVDSASKLGIYNRFGVVYDNLQRQTITSELSFDQPGKWNSTLKGEFFMYNLEKQAAPWHLPAYRITGSGAYYLRDLLVFRLDLFVIGERYAPSFVSTEGAPIGGGIYKKHLDLLVDANINVAYFLTKRWTVFVDVYNLANSSWQRWNEYPMQGFTALGGTSYSFWPRKRG